MEIKHRFNPRQNIHELDWFVSLLKNAGVKRFLEIGSRFGGSLWHIGQALSPSLIVSVDLPADDNGKKSLLECVSELNEKCKTVLFMGNSRHKEIIADVSDLAPFDAVFIDADHSLDGVTADWNNYGSMAPIIAFHDVAWRRENRKGIYVAELWDKLKPQYRNQEFVAPNSHKGIGVLWR